MEPRGVVPREAHRGSRPHRYSYRRSFPRPTDRVLSLSRGDPTRPPGSRTQCPSPSPAATPDPRNVLPRVAAAWHLRPMIRSRTVAIALGVIALGACRGEPEPAGGRFDGALADSLVRQQVAFGPRVPGLEAHDRALAWMVEYLKARADTVETMPFTHVTASGDTLELANVFARFRPEEPARILLIAHWDSRPVAEMSPDSADRRQPVPGANDGASGVAILLALADLFSREPPPVGV